MQRTAIVTLSVCPAGAGPHIDQQNNVAAVEYGSKKMLGGAAVAPVMCADCSAYIHGLCACQMHRCPYIPASAALHSMIAEVLLGLAAAAAVATGP
jgi:hypothetical protein